VQGIPEPARWHRHGSGGAVYYYARLGIEHDDRQQVAKSNRRGSAEGDRYADGASNLAKGAARKTGRQPVAEDKFRDLQA